MNLKKQESEKLYERFMHEYHVQDYSMQRFLKTWIKYGHLVIPHIDNLSIKVEGVSIFFPRQTQYQIQNMDYTFINGETYAVLGPNGSGKTTFLMALLNNLQFDGKISVTFNNIPISYKHFTQKYLLQVVSGNRLPGQYTIFEILSEIFYLRNINFILEEKIINNLYKFRNKINTISPIYQLILSLCDLLDITHITQNTIDNMSLGQQQKVGILCAFFSKSILIICDEIFRGLDYYTCQTMHKVIKFFRDMFNMTFIITSHAMNDLSATCDEMLFFKNNILHAKFNINDVKSQFWLYEIQFNQDIERETIEQNIVLSNYENTLTFLPDFNTENVINTLYCLIEKKPFHFVHNNAAEFLKTFLSERYIKYEEIKMSSDIEMKNALIGVLI